MGRGHGRLWRWHARAAHHIYRGLREDGRMPWLGWIVLGLGLSLGALADVVIAANGWAEAGSARGGMIGAALAGSWLLFAAFAGGGYGPEDRR